VTKKSKELAELLAVFAPGGVEHGQHQLLGLRHLGEVVLSQERKYTFNFFFVSTDDTTSPADSQ
jgi:hypothetical protein